MSSLSRIWRDSVLQLSTVPRFFCDQLGPGDVRTAVCRRYMDTGLLWRKTLEVFHVKCQRQILHIRWSMHSTNADHRAPLTTYHEPHQTTSFVSIQPHSPSHSGAPAPFTVKSLCHPVGTGDVHLVAPCWLDRPASSGHWLWSLPISGDKLCSARPWWSDTRARAGYALTTTMTDGRSMSVPNWIGGRAELTLLPKNVLRLLDRSINYILTYIGHLS